MEPNSLPFWPTTCSEACHRMWWGQMLCSCFVLRTWMQAPASEGSPAMVSVYVCHTSLQLSAWILLAHGFTWGTVMSTFLASDFRSKSAICDNHSQSWHVILSTSAGTAFLSATAVRCPIHVPVWVQKTVDGKPLVMAYTCI